MANLNRIILVGRLTADPEARATLDGLPMAKFRLAVNRPQGGVDFIDVIAWRRLAEVCGQYLRKGQLVLVEGRIQVRSFEDQNGKRRWATEVVARNMQMVEKSKIQNLPAGEAGPKSKSEETMGAEEIVDEGDLASDLPF